MKRTIICNIPMKKDVVAVKYENGNYNAVSTGDAVMFPINSIIGNIVNDGDELDIVLLTKTDKHSSSDENTNKFVDELNNSLTDKAIKINISKIDTEFSQDKSVHEELMVKIIEKIDNESCIMADITYGSKDMAIVLFAALGFSERSLGCHIDNIVYGQASFDNGKPVDTKICDMIPLFYMSSITNTIQCGDYNSSRKMLESLLTL